MTYSRSADETGITSILLFGLNGHPSVPTQALLGRRAQAPSMLPQGTAGLALTATSTVAGFPERGTRKASTQAKKATFAIRCETGGCEVGRTVANTDNS